MPVMAAVPVLAMVAPNLCHHAVRRGCDACRRTRRGACACGGRGKAENKAGERDGEKTANHFQSSVLVRRECWAQRMNAA